MIPGSRSRIKIQDQHPGSTSRINIQDQDPGSRLSLVLQRLDVPRHASGLYWVSISRHAPPYNTTTATTATTTTTATTCTTTAVTLHRRTSCLFSSLFLIGVLSHSLERPHLGGSEDGRTSLAVVLVITSRLDPSIHTKKHFQHYFQVFCPKNENVNAVLEGQSHLYRFFSWRAHVHTKERIPRKVV